MPIDLSAVRSNKYVLATTLVSHAYSDAILDNNTEHAVADLTAAIKNFDVLSLQTLRDNKFVLASAFVARAYNKLVASNDLLGALTDLSKAFSTLNVTVVSKHLNEKIIPLASLIN